VSRLPLAGVVEVGAVDDMRTLAAAAQAPGGGGGAHHLDT
jgi:hypothetical protein